MAQGSSRKETPRPDLNRCCEGNYGNCGFLFLFLYNIYCTVHDGPGLVGTKGVVSRSFYCLLRSPHPPNSERVLDLAPHFNCWRIKLKFARSVNIHTYIYIHI